MAENNFIVAIELGSSKIRGIAGIKSGDGSVKVAAYAQADSTSFMRKGTISNIVKATAAIRDLKSQLEDNIKKPISKVYVGMCGLYTHSEIRTVGRNFMEQTQISAEQINHVVAENAGQIQPDTEILEVITQEYRIDKTYQFDPVGALANQLEGNFLNIVTRSSSCEYIRKCFKDADLQIADLIVSYKATATTALSPMEMNSGCALVYLGAETTTVSIFKKGILRHLCVIPLGSTTITRDLFTLQIEDEAEILKFKYGTALVSESDNETGLLKGSIKLGNGLSVEIGLIAQYVAARMEEILSNVWNQIQNTGYDREIIAGIILTGGGSNLEKIVECMKKLCPEAINVRVANTLRSGAKIGGIHPAAAKDGAHQTILGLLLLGEEECCSKESFFEASKAATVVKPIAEETLTKKAEEEEDVEEAEMTKEEKHKEPAVPKGPSSFSKWKDKFGSWLDKNMGQD